MKSRTKAIVALRKQLGKAEGIYEFVELIRLLLLDRKVRQARTVAKLAIKRFPKKYEPAYGDLGICEWILDNRTEAIAAWRLGLHTQYRDPAGGISTRLLLWYAAVLDSNRALRVEAESLLEKALTSMRAVHWPAPIARYVLGQITEGELSKMALAKDEHVGGDSYAKDSILYIGAMAFKNKDVVHARACFARCADGIFEALAEDRCTLLLLPHHDLRHLAGLAVLT